MDSDDGYSSFSIYRGIGNDAVHEVRALAGSCQDLPPDTVFSAVVFCELNQADAEVQLRVHRYRWGERNWGRMWVVDAVLWKGTYDPPPEVQEEAEAWREQERHGGA